MNELHWENARVDSVYLGIEDHGIMTMGLNCTGGGWTQTFGNRNLNDPVVLDRFIRGVFAVLSINNIEDIKGQMVRIGRDKGLIRAIKPIIEDFPVFYPENLDENSGLLYAG